MSLRVIALGLGIAVAACGKVSNLSDQAGLSSAAYLPVALPGGPLLAATVNLPYKDLIKTQNGLAPFVYSISKGALPVGLSLDVAAGVISGTVPDSEVGKTATFTASVTDANAQTAQQSYTLAVNAYTFTISPDVLPPVVPHLAYTAKLLAIGALPPLTMTYTGNLPDGMTFDPKTGIIAADGILAAATAGKVTFSVTDKNGVVVTKDYQIAIAHLDYKPVAFTGAALAPAPVGSPYKDLLLTSGGALPLAFKVTSGNLPPGLALDPVSGVISGTIPSANAGGHEAVFGVDVTDAYGQKDTRTFTLTQAPYAITIVPTTVPTVIPSIPFSMQFAALGATAPVKFSLSGALPNKLRFAADGTLATIAPHVGSADAQSNWAVDITATDANGVVGTVSVTINVDKVPQNSSPLTIQTGTLSTMIAGTAYSAGVTVTGGVAPLTFAIQSGSLPTGLTLDPASGAISGNLGVGAAGAAYAAVLLVTDANSQTASKTYSGTVSAGSSRLAILSTVISTPIAGGNYSSVVAVIGGQPAYTFSIQSGTLPTGLTLNSSTGVISGNVGSALGGTSYLFTVGVADTSSQTASMAYSGMIGSVSAPLAIQTVTLPNPVAGNGYSAGISVTGGVAPLHFTLQSGSLPAGLTLDPNAGVIGGTPPYSANGSSFAIVVKVADATSQFATKTFTGTVQSGATAVAITTTNVTAPTAGSPYAAVIAVTGGITPYAFTLTSGTLPTGVTLDANAGVLTGTPAYATANTTYNFAITVTDTINQTASRTYSGTVANVSLPVTIQTASLPNPVAGAAYSSGISVTGGVPPLVFSLQTGTLPTGMTLDANSGVISGTLAYSTAGVAYAVVVKVADAANQSTSKTYTGTVQSGASALSIATASLVSPTAGSAYAGLISVTGGVTPYTFNITSGALPSGLSIGSGTGAISGTPAYATAGTSFNFTVAVTDSASQTVSRSYSGTVANIQLPVTIQTPSLPNPTAGTGYSAGVTVTGGVAPLAFALQSGTLPTGLTLDAVSGVISGNLTYSQAGTSFAIVVKVTDAANQTATKTYTGTVQSGATAVAINSANLASPVAGTTYAGVVSVTGGVTPYAFTLTNALPSGLTLDAAAGVISGTPTYATAGTAFNFTVTVTDAINQTNSKTYTGTVGNVASTLVIATSALPAPVAGTSYSAGISVTGGVSPFTFSIQSGTLPSPLTLDGPSGVISGTLTYGAAGGSYAVVVKVADSGGQSATKTYTGTVQSGATTLTIATSSLAAPTAGSAYSGLISVTGGVTPYAFSVTTGSMPPGLSLGSSTGAITGTPTYASAATAYSFTITVTDQSSQTVAKAYSGTIGNVSPAMAIQTASLVTPVAGAAYSAGISVTGGVAPLTFTIQSGSFPTGLTLASSTGILSGNLAFATAGTAFVAVVKVADSAGQTATKTYSDTVTNGATTLTIGSGALPTPAAGTNYAAVVPVTGGVTPYAFTISSGALPTPLTISSTLGVISGTPAWSGVGSGYAYTVTVTDGSNQTASKTYSGTVGSAVAALSVATTTIATPTAGSGYLASIAATGGVPPYTFAVTSGTLPSPLTLAGGVISGTVAAALRNAPYLFTITATDSASAPHTASQSYSGNIADYPLSVVPATLDVATPGIFYDTTVTAFGGVPPYTYALTGTLPSGLHLTTSTGDINGNVADSESGLNHTISITATDANGATGTKSYTISTATFGITLTTASLASATEGQAYTATLAASGGTGPYTYDYTGSLPAGVGMTAAGALFGTPASGAGSTGGGTAYPITIHVRDSTNAVSAGANLSLSVVVTLPTMAAGNLTTGVLGVPYRYTVAASGGRPPYTYTLIGSLPTGLSFSAPPLISGTPTVASACPANQFAITATDALSHTSTATVYQCIPTTNGIVLSNSSLANAVEGVAYSNSSTALTATGGTSPYTYAYTGSLPTGVGLSSSGTFFGTPGTGSGGSSYPIQITVSDSAGMVSRPYALTLTATVSTPTVGTAGLPDSVLGSPYTTTLTGVGGRLPYTAFNIASGSPPTGITLNTATGVLSGIPVSIVTCGTSPNFSVTVTDTLGTTSVAATKCINSVTGISITNASFPAVIAGTAYSSTVGMVGGTPPYTYSASSLPSCLGINGSTGVISGICGTGTVGSYTVYILAQDSTAPTPLTSARTFTIQIVNGLSVTSSGTLPPAGTGVAYSQTLAATGGATPYTFALSPSTPLPPGLSLSSGGVISGTPSYKAAVLNTPAGVAPTSASYPFTVVATDNAGQTATSATITINAYVAPKITTATMNPAVVNTPYAMDLQRTGGYNVFTGTSGASQLTWAVTPTLPSGLSLNSTSGRVSGTPTGAAGAYALTFTVTDGNGFSGSKALTLNIANSGRALDLKSAHFSEPCVPNLFNNASSNCIKNATNAIGKLTGTSQQFMVYSNFQNPTYSIQIAKIDSTGRIPYYNQNPTTINVALPANITGPITSVQVADIDQDGKLDIAFVDYGGRQVCVLWQGTAGTFDSYGMPNTFSSTSINCWPIPTGGSASNQPLYLSVVNYLRPDSTNYGKQDFVISDSTSSANVAASVAVLLNTCALGGSCTSAAAHNAMFSGYVATTGNSHSTTTIDGISSTTNMQVGLPIVGVGIPAGTTIASVVNGTSITLSVAATSTVTGVSISTPSGVVASGTTTNASNSVPATSTTGIAVGQPVYGANVPAGTYVTGVTANTSFTMSAVASGAASATVYGPTIVTPVILAAASSTMVQAASMGVGFFNAAIPSIVTGTGSTYAAGASTCPSIVLGGFQATATGNGYITILRQGWTGSQCQGDFTLHAATDEKLVANNTPYIDGITVADLNNDGISDIAVATAQAQPNSASVVVYLMPGGATFTGATTIAPNLQNLNGTNVGASSVTPFCLNGQTSCSYPSLLVTCGTDINIGGVGATNQGNSQYRGCLTVLPNQCSTAGCPTAFESASPPSYRIDYPAPGGIGQAPLLAPLVSPIGTKAFVSSWSASSATITTASTTGISVGQAVTGSNIPANAYVVSVVNSTTFTIAPTPTLAGSSVTLALANVPTSISGSWSANSQTVTTASTAGIVAGQTISGTNIPPYAYVQAVVNGTTLTISPAPTVAGSGITLSLPTVPTLNDVTFMGTDSIGVSPYLLTYARNGASTADPFKSSMMLNSLNSSLLEEAEIGTMKLIDMNGDGVLDLVAYLVNQGAVSTYTSGTINGVTYSMGSVQYPTYLNAPSYNGCNTSILTNCLPDPSFNTVATDEGYPQTWHIQQTMDVADLNNDGTPDVVTLGYYSRGFTVSLGTGSNSSTSPTLNVSTLYDIGFGNDYKPQAVIVADLDQDGIPDIVVAGIDTTGAQAGYVAWLKGNGDGTFQAPQVISSIVNGCTDIRSIATVDLDGDGRPELAILCYSNSAMYIARRRASDGTWISASSGNLNPGGGANGTVMKWGRLTSTSGMDMVVGGLDQSAAVNTTFRIIYGVSLSGVNQVTGAFNVSTNLGTYFGAGGYASDADITDLDGDGYSDIVFTLQSQSGTGNQNAGVFYTCRSTGPGTCTTKGWGMEGYETTSVVTGDVDGDGKPDVMVGYKNGANAAYPRLFNRSISRVLNTSY